MSDEAIPDDVWQTAYTVLEDWYRRTPSEVSEAVARAIMAERERCAQAFVSVAADAADGNRPLPLDIMKAVVSGIRMTSLEPAWGPAVRAATRESHASLYAIRSHPKKLPAGDGQ